jgi:Methane oxygenase PmoA
MRLPFFGASLALVAGGAYLASAVFAAPKLPKSPEEKNHVSVVVNEQARRVDVNVDGKPFTSYIWPTTLKKPVLYPLRTANGTVITRGYPLEQRPGERVDHPHHAGLWFNYEDVNGLDFWNNSDAIKPEQAPKMGTILQRKIVSAKSGAQGELDVETDWVTFDKKVLLNEHTHFVFRGGPGVRSIDRITTLTALESKVNFPDAKDGMLGLRVIRALEIPSDKAEVFTDASGRPTTVAKLDNTGVNGTYLTSEGKKGDAAWGTRSRWCNLSGMVGTEPVTITILDHRSNPGFPTYWHARGYGLFAVNPLGQKIFSNGKEELNFSLAPHASATFRYRILITSAIATPESTEATFKDFASAYH